MSQLNNKQLRYPLSGSFTGSLLGSATSASYVNLLQGSNVTINYTPSGILISSAGTGSGTSAAGTTGQIQYNYNGAFAGVPVLIYDGSTLRATGSFQGLITSASQAISSSHSLTASYALNAGTTINTGSFVTTSSFNAFTSSYNTGSFKGSLQGTASWANNVVSSSYALTASYALNVGTIINTGSFATTGSNTFIGDQIISGSIYLNSGSVIDSIGADIVVKAGVGNNAGVVLYNNDASQYLAVDSSGSYTNKFTVADRLTIAGSNGRLIYDGNITPNTSLAEVHANNDYPWLHKFYNDSFSTSSAAMAYFGWNDGRFVFHNESTQSIGLQVNGWNAENGLLVYSDKVAFINNVEVTGSLNVIGGITGSLLGTSSWTKNSTSASYALTASYALNAGTTVSTASLLTTATITPANTNIIRFTKGDGSTFDITVNTGSGGGGTPLAIYKEGTLLTSTASSIVFAGSGITTAYGIGGQATITIVTGSGGGGGTTYPGGSSSQIQYNNGGNFGGVPTLTYDGASLKATGSFTGSFTGSLSGTSSWSNNASTASFAPSYVLNSQTSSFITNSQTSSFITNSQTSSFVMNDQTGSMLASYVLNSTTASFVTTSSFNNITSSFATTGSNIFKGDQNISGSVSISGSGISVTGSLNVSSSINAYNINVGTPTANQWGQNLNGSYFNNFTSNTNTSEILRFVAGLLSASAPSPSPNTKTFSSIAIQEANNLSGSAATQVNGYLPSGHTTATSNNLAYLQNQGFASVGSQLFSNITNVFYQPYSASWRSVAAGTTTISSSVDSELFGLGPIQSTVQPNSFNVSGAIFYRYEDNSTGGSSIIQSSSQYEISQNSFGSNNGLTIGLINTANPTVIPPIYQDGKFSSPIGFTASLYNGGNRSFTSVSSSGYYQITASILIQSGSSTYSTTVSSPKRILWAPLTTIDSNIGVNSITITPQVVTSGSATSSSLSGAPYLTSMQYVYAATASGVFSPMYAASATLCNITAPSITAVSGSITLTAAGATALDTNTTTPGTIRTANVVYSSSNAVKTTGDFPNINDTVRFNPTYTLGGTGYTMTEANPAATTFNITLNAINRKGSAATPSTTAVTVFPAGNFGQPILSGSMQFFGGGTSSPTTLVENFVTESYRKQIGSSITPGLTTWNRNKRLTLGNYGELQVKPGFLVDPESSKGYWYPTSAYSDNNYKWYLREFDTGATVNRSNLLITISGTTATNWVQFDDTTNNKIAIGVIFDYQIANRSTANVRIYDAIRGNLSYAGSLDSQSANTYTNPFNDTVDVKGDFSGKTVSGAQITLGLSNVNNQKIDSINPKIWILIRYRGSIANSITGITVSTT